MDDVRAGATGVSGEQPGAGAATVVAPRFHLTETCSRFGSGWVGLAP
ncbi:hypothetical protein I552_7830 [Mycobacterium xenopi 3993]|nr:hypothetical protein I552_7830 [Mycobacterium xenopi 3993]